MSHTVLIVIEFGISFPRAVKEAELGQNSVGDSICKCCVESDDGYLRVLVSVET